MEGICVIGVYCERLLAADLRVEIAPGPYVIKAGLTKHGRCTYSGCSWGATFGTGTGFASGCPAFKTVHR
jgi:hypothetical protein